MAICIKASDGSCSRYDSFEPMKICVRLGGAGCKYGELVVEENNL